jgi:hypothetical protein
MRSCIWLASLLALVSSSRVPVLRFAEGATRLLGAGGAESGACLIVVVSQGQSNCSVMQWFETNGHTNDNYRLCHPPGDRSCSA